MKMADGQLTVLAGAVLFAGGTIADAIAATASPKVTEPASVSLALVAGVIVGVIGFAICIIGWLDAAKKAAKTGPQ